MFFLSDISNTNYSEATFTRKKGNKDKKKRKKKLMINDDTKSNIRKTRSSVNTGLQTANTARGIARETRNWLVLANKLGVI